jgi:ankyrin repeat protein
LLQDGADKKFLDRFGNNLLFLATHARNRKVVKKLLDEGYDANVSNIYGETPFKMAVASDKMEIFDFFFKRGLGDVSTVFKNNTNSIHVAASRGNEKIVDLLITAGVKTDALAVNGRSTLHAAAFGGNVAIIDRLSHLGIDVNNPKTERGPPLVLAAGRGYYKVVDRLLKLNADIHKTSKHERMDALLVASAYRRPKVVRRLLAAGADPCQRDAYGFTALDYAHRHLRTREAMGEARAGYTPISAATHRKLIHTTIRKSIQALIIHVEPLEPEYEDERVELLVILGYNLLRIHGNDSHEAALQCLIELAFPPDLAVFSCNFNCHMCHAPRNPRDVYICQ